MSEQEVRTVSANRVWVLDFSAEGPKPGDYIGYQSVHATPEGAAARLVAYLDEAGVVQGAEVLASATADNGSFAADLETDDGVKVSYGCHNMPVEE